MENATPKRFVTADNTNSINKQNKNFCRKKTSNLKIDVNTIVFKN